MAFDVLILLMFFQNAPQYLHFPYLSHHVVCVKWFFKDSSIHNSLLLHVLFFALPIMAFKLQFFGAYINLPINDNVDPFSLDSTFAISC